MKKKSYKEWAWVRALAELPLKKGFTFCSPQAHFRDKLLSPSQTERNDEYFRENATNLREIEDYVNAQIQERLKTG
jgi:hypothetical protein